MTTAIAFIFVGCWVYSMSSAASKVSSKELWVGQVQKGTLALQADGLSVLESKLQRDLTTPFIAVFEEIVLKLSEMGSPNSVILTMSNPEIGPAVIQAKGALTAQKAELKQLKTNPSTRAHNR